MIDIAICNIMIMSISKWLCYSSHSCRKNIISALSHALQHGHLLHFVATICLKVIKVNSAHGHTMWINLCGAPTKQAYSYNAQAKYVGETPHGYVHNHDPFPLDVEGHGLEIPTRLSPHSDWHSHWAWK